MTTQILPGKTESMHAYLLPFLSEFVKLLDVEVEDVVTVPPHGALFRVVQVAVFLH